MGQKIGLGCLIAIVIFLLFGLSCTRACFRSRRYYRRMSVVRILPEQVRPATYAPSVPTAPPYRPI